MYASPFCQCDDGMNLLFKCFICGFGHVDYLHIFDSHSSCSYYQNKTYMKKNTLFPTNIHLVWTPFTVKCISFFQVDILNVFTMYIWKFISVIASDHFPNICASKIKREKVFKLDFSLQMSKCHRLLCEILLNPIFINANQIIFKKEERKNRLYFCIKYNIFNMLTFLSSSM